MENNTIQLVSEYVVFKDKISIRLFASNCGLSRQTVYRALAGREVSARTALKIMRYFCHLRKQNSLRSKS